MKNKIYLNELPTKKHRGMTCIDWINSIGHKVHFIYEDIEDDLEIIDYIKCKNKNKLLVKYCDKKFEIQTSSLVSCSLGRILGKITSNFKIEIGQVFKDNKRDMEIIDKEYKDKITSDGYKQNCKWYKYKCNKCGWNEGWIIENHLLNGQGCACCKNQVVVKGINDITTTHPNLVKYFVNIEDAYTHTYSSNKKSNLKCPYCEFEREMVISNIYNQGFSCSKCGDGISYPEKFMTNILQQLKEQKKIEDFIVQFSKADTTWCNNYRYDFYFEHNNKKYIIETHGEQHYEENTNFKISLKENRENDKLKKDLAISNGIKEENYIVIDCRKSELEFIKQNILNSRLNELFDLSNIDWLSIGEKSERNLVKEVCDYWNKHNNENNENLTTTDLGKIFKKHYGTIRDYLKKGNKLLWCNYTPKYYNK